MQEIVKRYQWVVGVVCVIVCAIFAGKAVSHVLEALFLTESATPGKLRRAVAKRAAPAPVANTGNALVARHMFCSECVVVEEPVGKPGDGVPLTRLPLMLVATNIGKSDDASFATVRNTSTGAQGAFKLNDRLPAKGDAVVVEIAGTYVDFVPNVNKPNVLERISFSNVAQPKARQVDKPSATSSPKSARAKLVADINSGIRKISDTEYEIDAAAKDLAFANLGKMRKVRFRPAIVDGKTVGFRLFGMRPNQPLYKLGLRNGDTLNEVNGNVIDSMDKAITLYNKLKNDSNVNISITRRREKKTLKYTVR